MKKITLLLEAFSLCMVMGKLQHPNILFLMVDDLRPALGCYGDELAVTPSLDALSTAGVTFSSAFAQEALCGPSRTSLLTSRRPDSTRIIDAHHYWRDYHNFTTLPQHFKEHGYYTASAGKIFHPGRCSNYSDDSPYSWSAVPFHPSTLQYKNSPVCGLHSNMTNIVCPVQLEDQPEGTLPDLQTTHYAISFLQHWQERYTVRPACDSCDGNTARCNGGCPPPFFLAVGYHKPHIPLKFPRQFLDMFPLSSVPLPSDPRLPRGLPPVAYNPWNDLRWRDDVAALNLTFPYQAIPDHYSRLIRQAYYAATAYTDLLIGDLLSAAYLLHPDTLVVVMGDHGWSLGEHQEWSKFSNYEVATRVPLIVAPLSRYPAAKTALLADRSSVKYFRYKKYIKLQKKLLKNVNKWAGNGAHKYPQHWVHSEQAISVKFKAEESVPCVKNCDHAHFSSQPELVSKSKKEISEKRKKSFSHNSHAVRNIVRLNNRRMPDVQAELNELGQRNHHHSHNLVQLIKRARRVKAHRKTIEKESNKVWLNLKRNFTYNGLVELLDVFPTLADLAGISQVPSCDGSSRVPRFCPKNLIRKRSLLRVLKRCRRRIGDRKMSWSVPSENNLLERHSNERHKADLRKIFIEKLCAAVELSSKMFSSVVSVLSKRTNGYERRQKICNDPTSAFKLRTNLTRSSTIDTVNTFAGVALVAIGRELKKKHLHAKSRKLLKTLFRSRPKMTSAREIRLCTEGQSLVPYIVEQVSVNSKSTNYTEHTPRRRYFGRQKLTSAVPSEVLSNLKNFYSEVSNTLDYGSQKNASRRLTSSGISQLEFIINQGLSENRSSVQETDTWLTTPEHSHPALLALAYVNAAHLLSSGETREVTPFSDDISCVADAVHGRLAISQYPRPSFWPSQHPDSDQPKLKDVRIMGYSLRSHCFRYTLWVAYNSSSQTSNFDEVLAEELYDHRLDPTEDRNLLYDPMISAWQL